MDENGNDIDFEDEQDGNESDSDDAEVLHNRDAQIDPILEQLEQEGIDVRAPGGRVDWDQRWASIPIPERKKGRTRAGIAYEEQSTPKSNRKYNGAHNIPMSCRTPGEHLDLLFSGTMLETFVYSTNNFVLSQEKPAWTPEKALTVETLKTFFATMLYMGIVQRPEIKMYWENCPIYGDSFVPTLISRNKFFAILYNLHWTDTSVFPAQERVQMNQADGYWVLQIFRDKGPNKRQRGEMECRVAEFNGLAPGEKVNVYLTSWMDSKPVHLISTWPPKYDAVKRNSKNPQTGAFEQVEIRRPTTVGDYNRGMGGTDKQDQLGVYYDQRLRTKRWPLRLVLHFLRVSLINSMILYNHGRSKPLSLL